MGEKVHKPPQSILRLLQRVNQVRKKLLWICLIIPLVLSPLYVNLIGVAAAPETHDIAVISVTPYPTTVGLGQLANVTVIIKNQGTENETFSVTAYYNNTTIETQNVANQAPNTNKTLTFVWNTTGITTGTYSINATASIVSGEIDKADNTLISPTKVKVVSPYITVLPRNTVVLTSTLGQNYTISIYTNYNGSDIWGYEFELTYNPLVLYGVKVVNGDLITEEGDLLFSEGDFNNTVGKLSLPGAAAINMSTIPYTKLASTGPGVLANVTFTIVGLGESPIIFGSKTRLMRTDGTNIIDYFDDLDPDPTRGKFLHGSFRNVLEAIHDVVVIGIDPYPQSVEKGELVTINVTIRNKGTAAESVSVKVYYGYDPVTGPLYPIGSPKILNVESASNKTISFSWNTTEASVGTHPITAIAELPEGITDINPDDNTLKIDDAVEVKLRESPPLPILEIFAIAAVIVVIMIVVYNLKQRKRKKPAFD